MQVALLDKQPKVNKHEIKEEVPKWLSTILTLVIPAQAFSQPVLKI